ncbi:hypothetical protein Bhyg_18025, partial [Pseudolycoriella hygida]
TMPCFILFKCLLQGNAVKIAQAGHDNGHDQQVSFSVKKILRNLKKKDNCMCKPDSAENLKLKAD